MSDTVNEALTRKCPYCGGSGGSVGIGCGPGGCRIVSLKCAMCEGGQVPADKYPRMAASIVRGEELRADRIRRDLSLREEARRLGIKPSDLSHVEHGRKLLEEVKRG